ncbi:MAG: Lsr2 family protein [Nocardioidaceae bacterium]|jgi:hypothetical protein|nr:Lsr2 family protein [Nocardioidaceae bacterium]
MAQKVQVLLVDDLDGGSADETVQFALDGVSYEIDLSGKNAAKMRDALAGYVGEARRVGARTRSRRGRSQASVGGPGSAKQVREWARAHGYKISDRGRVPANVLDAYRGAN